MLSFQTVLPDTLELLRVLMNIPFFKDTRLVGGTSLALQYGHRRSVDLDLFGNFPDDDDEMVELFRNLRMSVKIGQRSSRVKPFYLNGIKVDFVRYQYSWIDQIVSDGELRLASPKDIAAMKIYAIQGRGSKKDFIDMFYLLKNYTLDEILNFYRQKYPEGSEYRALLSLTYFADADPMPMPEMFTNDSWMDMKSSIIDSVKAYNNKKCGKKCEY